MATRERVTIRTAFFTIVIGTMDKVKTAFRQFSSSIRCPARRLTRNREMLDRIPLHSFATSMVRPGRWKKNPSRYRGTPVRPKKTDTASADHFWRKKTILSRNTKGRGIMKNRKRIGNAAPLHAPVPQKNNNPPTQQTTKEN